MKPFDRDKLKENFWAGNTSFSDEEMLKEIAETDSSEAIYLEAMQQEHFSVKNIEKSSWNFIQQKRKNKRRVRFSIAASVAIVVGIMGLSFQNQRQAKLLEQFIILEQTLNHVSSELTTTHKSDVIYQDDYIVIVANN
ncbi:MAG: hypothetical protein PF541_00845 [Prolixibacteraceae bacterium]|jgi:hypothetical protein|nr:hypothetical protein [Prolixibacteraceae bacterium]